MTTVTGYDHIFTARADGQQTDVLSLVSMIGSLSPNRYRIVLKSLEHHHAQVLGHIELKAGMVLEAISQDLSGKEALGALLGQHNVLVEAYYAGAAAPPRQQPVGPLEGLLLNFAVASDHAAADRPAPVETEQAAEPETEETYSWEEISTEGEDQQNTAWINKTGAPQKQPGEAAPEPAVEQHQQTAEDRKGGGNAAEQLTMHTSWDHIPQRGQRNTRPQNTSTWILLALSGVLLALLLRR